MKIEVIPFGQIAEVTGSGKLAVEATDTDGLKNLLEIKFPDLRNRKYAIAVNRQLITHNTPLQQNAEVALLPPFSGG
jgi:molybdopterin synthase sulfur carrier subunit